MSRFHGVEHLERYVAETTAMADGRVERHVARLSGQWAHWHFRWSSRPTAANDAREAHAWTQLREALAAAGLEGTWLDPAS